MWKKKTLLIGIACVAIGLVIVMFIRSRGSDPSRILARADEYFAEGQYDNARLEYSKLIRKEPGNAHAYRQIGYGYLEQGLTYQGIVYLAKALELEPDNSVARGQLAPALMSLRDLAGARAQALEILDRVPDDQQAILVLARTSLNEELVAETRQRLAGLDPDKHAAFHLAQAMLAGFTEPGASDSARASLDRALELEPDIGRGSSHPCLILSGERRRGWRAELASQGERAVSAPLRSSGSLRGVSCQAR